MSKFRVVDPDTGEVMADSDFADSIDWERLEVLFGALESTTSRQEGRYFTAWYDTGRLLAVTWLDEWLYSVQEVGTDSIIYRG